MTDEDPTGREGMVNPFAAAERAIEHLQAGRDKGALVELAHGLASLARQHNALVERYLVLREVLIRMKTRQDTER